MTNIIFIFSYVYIYIYILLFCNFLCFYVCTLNFSAAIFALLASIEIVAITLTAAVSELFANAITTVIKPLDLILGTGTMFIR